MDEPSQEFSLQGLVARRWRVMGATLAVTIAIGIGVVSQLPRNYIASSKVLIMRADQRMGGMKVVNDAIPELSQASRPILTQAELLRVGPLFQRVVARLDLRDAKGAPLPPEKLARDVKVSPIKDTDLIEVSYADADPQKAKAVLSAIGTAFLELAEEYRRDGVREGLKIVDEQLDAARKHLAETERRLTDFKRQTHTVALNEEILAFVRDVSDLDRLRRLRRVDFESARARAANLRLQLGMSPQSALDAVALAANPRLRALQDQLSDLESGPAAFAGLGADHPDMVALRQREAFLKRKIAAEIKAVVGKDVRTRAIDDVRVGLLKELTAAETDVLAAQAGIRTLDQMHASLVGRMTALPERETRLAQFSQEVDVARRIYQELLQKREEARLNLAIAPTYARIVQPPVVPGRPELPAKGATLPLLLISGLTAAFVAGFLKDLRERSADYLASAVPELRLLSVLPTLPAAERKKGALVVRRGSYPAYLEGISALSLALDDALEGRERRVIGITSAMAGEGKSVTIANLAYYLAEIGHRVLLVDGDPYRPAVHTLAGLPNKGPGLAEVLQGALAAIEAVRPAGRIDVVLSGASVPGSRVAALNANLRQALDTWRQAYDVVLIDLPPLVALSEVVHFGRQADGLILLVNNRRVDLEAFRHKVQRLRSAKVPVLGLLSISNPPAGSERYYRKEPARV